MAPVCSSVPVNLDSVTVNESRTLKLTPLNPAIVILDVFGPVLLVTRQVTSILCVAWCVFLLRSRKKKKKKLYIGSFNYQNQAEIHVVFSHVHTLCIIWCFPREFKRQATGWNAPLPWLKTLIPLSTKHFQQLQRDARHEAAKMWSHHCFAENTTRLWACGGMELSVSSGITFLHHSSSSSSSSLHHSPSSSSSSSSSPLLTGGRQECDESFNDLWLRVLSHCDVSAQWSG